jgi:hypothetical protein
MSLSGSYPSGMSFLAIPRFPLVFFTNPMDPADRRWSPLSFKQRVRLKIPPKAGRGGIKGGEFKQI